MSKICLEVCVFFLIWQCFLKFFSEPEQQQLVKQRLWDEGPTLREEDEILREEDEVIFQILFSKLFFIFHEKRFIFQNSFLLG